LKLEIFSQVMSWGRLPEFLFREEHAKKELICLPKALIGSILTRPPMIKEYSVRAYDTTSMGLFFRAY
jgi:hypothetical protein